VNIGIWASKSGETMKIKKIIEEINNKFDELDAEMDTLGFGWVVNRYSIKKAFGDIDRELRKRRLAGVFPLENDLRDD